MRDALDLPDQWALIHLKQAGRAVNSETLARLAKMPEAQTAEALKKLTAKRTARKMPDGTFLCSELIERVAETIVQTLEQFHGENPTRGGMSRGDLSVQVEAGEGLFDPALDGLLDSGRVEQVEKVLGLPGMGARLSAEDLDLCRRIEETLKQAGLAPPLPGDIADQLGVSDEKFAEMTALLSDQGRAVQLDRKVILHNDVVEEAKTVVLGLFADTSIFTTMEFRDALGASRKVAVPLLDHLDALKFTVRIANRRKPGAEAKKLLSPK